MRLDLLRVRDDLVELAYRDDLTPDEEAHWERLHGVWTSWQTDIEDRRN